MSKKELKGKNLEQVAGGDGPGVAARLAEKGNLATGLDIKAHDVNANVSDLINTKVLKQNNNASGYKSNITQSGNINM